MGNVNIFKIWRDWINDTNLGVRIVCALGLFALCAWAFNDLDALPAFVRVSVIAAAVAFLIGMPAYILVKLHRPLMRLFGVDD